MLLICRFGSDAGACHPGTSPSALCMAKGGPEGFGMLSCSGLHSDLCFFFVHPSSSEAYWLTTETFPPPTLQGSGQTRASSSFSGFEHFELTTTFLLSLGQTGEAGSGSPVLMSFESSFSLYYSYFGSERLEAKIEGLKKYRPYGYRQVEPRLESKYWI